MDGGDWQALPPDSATDETCWFQIPGVAGTATIDYYVWAKDSWAIDNDFDLWTTWPVCSPESTMVTFTVTTVGTEERPPRTGPARLTVGPNPFRGQTRFTYENAGAPSARLLVYSVDGTLVASRRMTPDGRRGLAASWDGTDVRGHRLSPGAYFYRVEAAGTVTEGKLLLQR